MASFLPLSSLRSVQSIPTDRIDSPNDSGLFAGAGENVADVALLIADLALLVGVIGLLYTLHTAGEFNGSPDAVKWLREMGPFKASVPVLAANSCVWLFLLSTAFRIALEGSRWVGITAFCLLPIAIVTVAGLAKAPTNAKPSQLIAANQAAPSQARM